MRVDEESVRQQSVRQQSVRQQMVDFVNQCGGRFISATKEQHEPGDRYFVTWNWYGVAIPEVSEYVIRAATREEFVACPWPTRLTEPNPPTEGLYFYETSLD